MKHIVYVSQAVRPFSQDNLADLLGHSRARNNADAISGLLIYRYNQAFTRGNFLQVLEGPAPAIEAVWQRISTDPRHHTIVVLAQGDSSTRMFGDWSMGFKNVDAAALSGYPGFSDLGSDAFWAKASPEALPDALTLLQSFYDGA